MKYRYIIYKVYSWTANKRGDTPIGNTILTLAMVHFFQLLTLLLLVDRLIIPLNLFGKKNTIPKGYLFVGMIVYFAIFYLLVYNKQRWDSYVEEYKNESEAQRKRGNRKVIAYLVGSILLFFISLPVLFTLGKYLHQK
jgi:hypothetical protein